jgi:5-methylcytosine-specific restriction protein A
MAAIAASKRSGTLIRREVPPNRQRFINMSKHARICPCGYRVAGGTLCACQQRRQAARPNSNARGYGTDWQELRQTVPHTPCTSCAKPYKNGFHLDHKLPRSAGGTDDVCNLHWLCHSCHSRKTAKNDGGFGHQRQNEECHADGGWFDNFA